MMTAVFDRIARGWVGADAERWRGLAEAALKGQSFEKRLITTTADRIRIEPVYTAGNAGQAIAAAGPVGAAPFTRGVLPEQASPWVIAQRIDLAEPGDANVQARTDLENGASGLVLVVRGREAAERGIRLATLADIDRLMDGILPELVSLTLEAGTAARRMAVLFAAWFEARGHDPARLSWCAGFDPAGTLAASGRIVQADLLAARAADAAKALATRGFRGPFTLLDGRVWSDAGASEAQELGLAIASALQSLRLLDRGGVPLEDAVRQLAFKLAVDADQFASIAKIRALRLLWARATEAMGLAPQLAEVRVESARRMLTARDPWVNLLRSTVACFAGAVGGANEITLQPFTAALGVPDGFARRIARNTQIILMEESGLGRVADPAGGSGYVESLTQALAGAAWDLFRQVEAQGGLIDALRAGFVQAELGRMRTARAHKLRSRRLPITGVSEFAYLDETPVAVLPADAGPVPLPQEPARTWPQPGDGAWLGAQIEAIRAGASAEALGAAEAPSISVEPLPRLRFAEPFEALRDAADAATARDGQRPAVFLAGLGTTAEIAVRATFARNLFEAGGLAVQSNDGFASVEAMIAAFKASGRRVACLTGTDETYHEQGEGAARALKSAGAETVVLAGQPGERRATLAAAGVDLFVHLGVDVVDALGDLHRRLGIG